MPAVEALLRLAGDYDVVLESFRPGVLDRLGCGYQALRDANPRIVYCAITGYGQTGPNTQRAGHDMNYLGLNGLLGLTGEPDGRPIQSAGQIADLGGGALMAAFGVMAALRERERSGEGQQVDVSMTDGSLAWLAMVAAQYLCDGEVPQRGRGSLNGGIACYLPYEASDGWVTCGALEPKFWRNFCEGVGRPDLIEKQFAAPGSEDGQAIAAVFKERTRDEWLAFNNEHDAMIEPVLELDEALSSQLVAEREMVVEMEQPELGPVRLLGVPIKLDRTPGDATRPAPALGEHTAEVLRGGRLLGGRGRGDDGVRSRGGHERRGRGREVHGMSVQQASANGLLKISELAERSGVPVATVRHYLREGLLPEPVKTSRNMAYYPPEFVERIRFIKQFQEERFMPLRVIRDLLEREDAQPERLRAMIELEDRILERALAGERERIDAGEVRDRYDVPQEVLDRLAELGVLTPDEQGYSPSDVRIIEAIGRFRAGGYDERIGFTVYDTLRYKRALEPVVAEEVEVLTKRLAGDVDPDRALEIIEAGIGPLNDLMSALHTKLLVARLRHHAAGRDG